MLFGYVYSVSFQGRTILTIKLKNVPAWYDNQRPALGLICITLS